MKTYILIFIVFISLKVRGQELFFNQETKLLTYEVVFHFDSMTADVLFDKSKDWFIAYFRNAKEVIRGESKPTLIKGTFLTAYQTTIGKMGQDFNDDIEVRIKNGAIKLTIHNISQADIGWGIETITIKDDGAFKTNKIATNAIEDIKNKCHALSESLRAHIAKKASEW